MEDQFKHGQFNWCELMTNDVDAAKKFYTKLFGWKTEDMSIPDLDHGVGHAGKCQGDAADVDNLRHCR